MYARPYKSLRSNDQMIISRMFIECFLKEMYVYFTDIALANSMHGNRLVL